MTKMFIRHQVADFAAWKPLFDEHEAARKKFGCTKSDVFTNQQNPNEILAVTEWNSKGQAEDFLQNSGIKTVMEKAGVITAPEITFSQS
jgi:quinol monooxygenase YgiN